MNGDRVSSGVAGIDELIDGGFLNNSTVLVSGGPGTGKTLLATQFLWEGLENGETCLYISTEELPSEIVHDAGNFGWDLDADSNQFEIHYINPSTRSEYFRQDVEELVKDMSPDRIVIDSISVLGYYWEEDKNVRSNITALVHKLKEWGATTMITAEAPDDGENSNTRHGIAEFVSDGVIKLDAKSMGSGMQRTLTVKKMRGTAIDGGIKDLEFTENGLRVE